MRTRHLITALCLFTTACLGPVEDLDGTATDQATELRKDAGRCDAGGCGGRGDAGRCGGGCDAGGCDGGPVDLNDGGPEDGGPEDGGPEDGGPEDGGPEDGGPEDGGPEDGGPSDAGPSACLGAITVRAGHFEGTTVGGTDQFGGGSSCVHAGAPDQIFHLRVPGHQRALISARAAFVPMLFVIDGASCSVDCGRPAGTNGQSTGLAWYNSSPEATELYFVIDWTGGWPNPSSIPSSAPYSLDISFDSGAPEGESCLDPASLPTGVASLVSPGYGTNDEGPGQGVDHVYTVSVPARSKLEVSVASMGLGGALADVYFYARPGTCGTSSFDARQFANGMNPTSWVYENTSSSAVEVTILLESFGTSNLGALIVTPIVSAL